MATIRQSSSTKRRGGRPTSENRPWVRIWIAWFLFPALAAAAQGNAAVTVTSRRYAVSLTGVETGESGTNTVRLDVRDRATGSTRQLAFANRTVHVQGLAFAGDFHLLVLGKLGSGGDIVTIVDLESGSVLDTIWAWQFTLCRDLGIAVYRFRYPPSSPPAYDSHVVLAYDMTGSPAENSRASRDPHLLPQEARGYILYPTENRLSGRVFIPAKDPRKRRQVRSPFACCSARKEIAFVEFFRGKMYLVRIDVSDGLNRPTVRKVEIPEESFVIRENSTAQEHWEREGVFVSSLAYEPGCRGVKLTVPESEVVRAGTAVIAVGQ